jgi:hypothetical protein
MAFRQIKMAFVQPAQVRAGDEKIRIGREQDGIELRTELGGVLRYTEPSIARRVRQHLLGRPAVRAYGQRPSQRLQLWASGNAGWTRDFSDGDIPW